jgi:hypothetical protein
MLELKSVNDLAPLKDSSEAGKIEEDSARGQPRRIISRIFKALGMNFSRRGVLSRTLRVSGRETEVNSASDLTALFPQEPEASITERKPLTKDEYKIILSKFRDENQGAIWLEEQVPKLEKMALKIESIDETKESKEGGDSEQLASSK